MAAEKDMTVGDPQKIILNFTIPVFIGNVFQQVYSMADTVIVGKFVGTKALAVKKANVLGQIKPGIPVWQTGEESKFPMTPYVIFPGNVGTEDTLLEAVEVLMKA